MTRVDVEKLAANLRVAAAGGSALPVEVHKNFKDKFGVTILEGYGLSETSPVASFSPFDAEPRVGSIGIPIPGVEMKLLEPGTWDEVNADNSDPDAIGEIAIKGHNIMKGYYGRPDATDEAIQDGWFRSGDLGRRDADGWYYIVDRSKDMIIRGGYNVYPREIEEVLMTHPDVSLAAVIGVPHESHGEEIKAVVILEDGATLTEDELVAWGKEQMAAYKYPRIVEFVPNLPMTATGKILKRELVMTLGRAAGFSIAVLMVLVGALWTGQGLGWIGGSSMSDDSTWAIIGPDRGRARRRPDDRDRRPDPPRTGPARAAGTLRQVDRLRRRGRAGRRGAWRAARGPGRPTCARPAPRTWWRPPRSPTRSRAGRGWRRTPPAPRPRRRPLRRASSRARWPGSCSRR